MSSNDLTLFPFAFLQPAYVVHIFPQCDFSHQQMADLTPDLLHGINEISHLLIIIATVGAQ